MSSKFGKKGKGGSAYADNGSSSSSGTGNEKLAEAQRKAEDVKGVMHKNIEMTLERGEKLEVMEDKAEQLESHASMFQKNATKVKRHFFCQYIKMTLLIFAIVAIIALIIGLTIWSKNKK